MKITDASAKIVKIETHKSIKKKTKNNTEANWVAKEKEKRRKTKFP